jgi:endonuclease/exonuclease/phosphatase family metal-dependent hydrolase
MSRIVLLVYPTGIEKTFRNKFQRIFQSDPKWEWIRGDQWKTSMRAALDDGLDMVIDRENCTKDQRSEFYQEIDSYNMDNLENPQCIDHTQVIALVCHPSCGCGNKEWYELFPTQKPLELSFNCEAYRVLAIGDGNRIEWNRVAIQAAAKRDWKRVTQYAESATYKAVDRQFYPKKLQVMPLSIMSYNILWQTAPKCTWKERLPTLIKTVRLRMPQILCIQEVGPEMYEDIVIQLPLYGSTFGLGTTASFGCATFFLLQNFQLSSENPRDLSGSNKQHKKPRVVAHITTLQSIFHGKKIAVCNVHLLYGFNVYMEIERTRCIQEIQAIMNSDEYNKLPQLICGDFNSKAGSQPLVQMKMDTHFIDMYHTLVHIDPEMTVEPFQYAETIAVDYVFATKHFTPINVLLMPSIASMRGKQLPILGFEASDHFYHLVHLKLLNLVDG